MVLYKGSRLYVNNFFVSLLVNLRADRRIAVIQEKIVGFADVELR